MNLEKVRESLNFQRIERYRLEGDTIENAIDRYLKNAKLVSELYLPLNFFEVVIRNGISKHLEFRFGDEWYATPQFRREINGYFASEVDRCLAECREEQLEITSDWIVSLLSLGFWSHVTTKRWRAELWGRGWKVNFPNGHRKGESLDTLHALIEEVRNLRNRAYHHQPIIDRPVPVEDTIGRIVEAVGWRCEETMRLLEDAMG